MKKVFEYSRKGGRYISDQWINSEGSVLCGGGINRFYAVPEDCDTIYLTVSDKPMKGEGVYIVNINRWNLRHNFAASSNIEVPESGNTYYFQTDLHTDELVVKYFGKLDMYYVKLEHKV